MVSMLRADIQDLERALMALRRSGPDRAQAQRRFHDSSRLVCHSALSAGKNYPSLFGPEVAAELEKLFIEGMHALDKAGARQELKRNVSIRYEKLRPFIERAKRDAAVAGPGTEACFASEWPVLDGGRYLGGTLGREEIYGDDGR